MASHPTHAPTIEIRVAAQRGVLSVLELRGENLRPRLDDVRKALFELRIQVVRHEGDRKVERFHVAEFDGARIAPQRRDEMLALLAQRLGRPGIARAGASSDDRARAASERRL